MLRRQMRTINLTKTKVGIDDFAWLFVHAMYNEKVKKLFYSNKAYLCFVKATTTESIFCTVKYDWKQGKWPDSRPYVRQEIFAVK